ncbi:hypothetical protein GCM10010252_11310 [Streptomyces aureoverticillatus]|nr:hypothetical protein GCM10010252_11310 [Streptomyces aureoverticillatus]
MGAYGWLPGWGPVVLVVPVVPVVLVDPVVLVVPGVLVALVALVALVVLVVLVVPGDLVALVVRVVLVPRWFAADAGRGSDGARGGTRVVLGDRFARPLCWDCAGTVSGWSG